MFYVVVNCNGQVCEMDISVIFKFESLTNMMLKKDIMLVEMKCKTGQNIKAHVSLLRYRFIACDNLMRNFTIHVINDDSTNNDCTL